MRINIVLILCLSLFAYPGFAVMARAKNSSGWRSVVPHDVNDSRLWQQLVPKLMKHHMYYGALAAASDMINFFDDLPTKRLAYKTIVQLIDLGYPFSTRAYFVPGDIEPAKKSEFSQSYFLYKGIVNLNDGMKKWADYYFNKINKKNFPKYLFFQALQEYAGGHLKKAKASINKMLKLIKGPGNFDLAKKAARTLARIDYQQKKYKESAEIYETFLLKTNPISPEDWLEAAWSLYRLKKYNKALGLLYNLESKAAGRNIYLEKYILRALIYRKMCSYKATHALIKKFNREYGKTIFGIKIGEPLSRFVVLNRIVNANEIKYEQEIKSIRELKKEFRSVSKLPRRLRPVAKYVYVTAFHMYLRTENLYRTQALETAAQRLVILGESLKFLQFDVMRSQYNPNTVFKEKPVKNPVLLETNKNNFIIHWPQWGDYWRDERLSYKGTLKNKCD